MVRPELTVITMDRSGTMGERDYAPTRLDGAKAAANLFLRIKPEIDRHDLTAVVVFNESANQITNFGEHPVTAAKLLEDVMARGSTSITSGLDLTLSVIERAPQMKVEPIRRCVLLSDGHHNRGLSPSDAGTIAHAVKERVIVDVIGIGGANDELLRPIAMATGGLYIRCNDASSLLSAYERLAAKKVLA